MVWNSFHEGTVQKWQEPRTTDTSFSPWLLGQFKHAHQIAEDSQTPSTFRDSQKLGGKSAGSPRWELLTCLLFCCVWGDKREWRVQPSEMLLICSDSQPFYPIIIPSFPRMETRETQNIKKKRERERIVDLCSRQQKQLGSLCFNVRILTLKRQK